MKNKTRPKTNSGALSEWTHLSWFQLQYLSRPVDNTTAHVFRNGRQQVPIKVIIEARNKNDEVVALSVDELKTITLIDFDTRQPLPNTDVNITRNSLYDDYPESGKFSDDYLINDQKDQVRGITQTSTRRGADIKRTFETINTGSSSEPKVIQAATFYLYLTTTNIETLHLGAMLPSPIGGYIHTCSKSVPPGGAPTGGEFNSSLTIAPQPPRRFPAAQFSMYREDVPVNDSDIDVDIYTLGFSDPNFLIRKAILHMLTNRGWHFSDYVGDHRNYYHYAFTEQDVMGRHYKNGWISHVEFPVNTRLELEGKISIARVTENHSPVIYDITTIGKVGYVDNHGNESILYLRPVNNGNEIVISDN